MLQISLSSDSLTEQQLYDYGIYRMRQQLAPIPGVTLPTPAGGKYRQIMVDLDPAKLVARGLTPLDVVNAVNAQNLTLPSGTAKIGDTQYAVLTNATPASIAELNDIPVKVTNGATVFVKDVGPVHDGWLVQQNVACERTAAARFFSASSERQRLHARGRQRGARRSRPRAPPRRPAFRSTSCSTSRCSSSSPSRAYCEGAIAAGLTAPMILLFLGSWRSTLVVTASIPLSILSSLVVLYFLGETLNTMTLGGLALAVGILVDDSTVTIENTHRLLNEEGQPLPQATLHGAAGIAIPTLVSTLAISCVFTSVIFLDGPAKYLFTPLGFAVVFAMLASYALSGPDAGHDRPVDQGEPGAPSPADCAAGLRRVGFVRLQRMRAAYVGLLTALLARRFVIPVAAVLVSARLCIARLRRPRLLSADRWRPDPAPRPGAGRHPHRGDRAHLPGGRGQDPRGHPRTGSPLDRRQYRTAGTVLQSRIR